MSFFPITTCCGPCQEKIQDMVKISDMGWKEWSQALENNIGLIKLYKIL